MKFIPLTNNLKTPLQISDNIYRIFCPYSISIPCNEPRKISTLLQFDDESLGYYGLIVSNNINLSLFIHSNIVRPNEDIIINCFNLKNHANYIDIFGDRNLIRLDKNEILCDIWFLKK